MPATPLPQATAIKLDGAFTEAIWEQVPAISDFRQRDPKDGGAADLRDRRARWPTTRPTCTSPSARTIPSPTARRPAHAPRHASPRRTGFGDRRLVPRSAHRVRVRRQPRRREGGPLLVQRRRTTTAAGTRCGTSRSRATPDGWRAEFRIPFSQLRFHPVRRRDVRLRRRPADRPAERNRHLAAASRRARPAIVSSFGDLTGLQLGQSPKRLELVPYVVGDVNTQPAEPGNPLARRRPIQKATVGADLKYALRPGLTLTGDGESRLRPGRSRSRGRQPQRRSRRSSPSAGRSSSKARGIFTFDLDCNDGSCSGLFYPRRIGRAPRGSPTCPTAACTRGAAADDDSRRGEADRPRRRSRSAC